VARALVVTLRLSISARDAGYLRLICRTIAYGLLPQVGSRSIVINDSGFGLQSYIRHLEWDQVVACRHAGFLPLLTVMIKTAIER
jgi:hypothetical protein